MLPFRQAQPLVTFTFDEVFASACEIGAPILERHGARGTFYVSGSLCGTGKWLDAVATIDQLRTIWARGHEIGCHTYAHAAVSSICSEQLGLDLERNSHTLKAINDNLVLRNFAYPYGDLSFRTKRYLKSRFNSLRSVHPGINTKIVNLGSLKAYPLENSSIDRTTIDALLAQTVRAGGWLIFYTHDVAERPTRFGVSPDLLEWAVMAAKQDWMYRRDNCPWAEAFFRTRHDRSTVRSRARSSVNQYWAATPSDSASSQRAALSRSPLSHVYTPYSLKGLLAFSSTSSPWFRRHGATVAKVPPNEGVARHPKLCRGLGAVCFAL